MITTVVVFDPPFDAGGGSCLTSSLPSLLGSSMAATYALTNDFYRIRYPLAMIPSTKCKWESGDLDDPKRLRLFGACADAAYCSDWASCDCR